MTIGQKARSLHCGLQAGLNIKTLDGHQVIQFCDVPFELERILAKWLAAQPAELQREYSYQDRALTLDGWSAFVSWMVRTLDLAADNPEGV